jgi:hypothetical protein
LLKNKNKFTALIPFTLVFLTLIISFIGTGQVGIQEDIQGFVTEFASLIMFIIIALIFVDVLMYKIANVSILAWIFSRFGA